MKEQEPYFPPVFVPSLNDLEQAAAEGRVRRVSSGDGLVLFVYTRETFFEKSHSGWDPVTMAARGLVFDAVTGRLVALPFPKFFNLGERPETQPHALPAEPLMVMEKLDGSLVILFHDGQRWRTCTKGSFSSEQAVWGWKWIQGNIGEGRLDAFRGLTLLFEAIAPRGTFSDPLVVDYGDTSEMVLLAAFDVERRAELKPHLVDAIATTIGVRRPQLYSFASVSEVVRSAERLGIDMEGYVLLFLESGYRVKVKGAAYLQAAKALNQANLRLFWESMSADGVVDRSLFQYLTPEIIDDLEPEIQRLEELYRGLLEAGRILANRAGLIPDRAERALWIKKNCGELASLVFALVQRKDENAHRIVHRLIRPIDNAINRDAERIYVEVLQRLEDIRSAL